MKRILFISFSIVLTFLFLSSIFADEKKDDRAVYRKRVTDAALKRIRENNEKIAKERQEKTEKIVKKHKAEKKEKRENRKILRFDVSGIIKPTSLDQFESYYHFPPVAQFSSGMCWCFSQTALFESEIYRIHGKKIKLSELHTVYYEYIEKAKGFVRERGYSYFAQGSECDAVIRIWKKYGCVPAEIYEGILVEDKMHNHSPMFKEMNDFLHWIKKNNYWDEKLVVETIKTILNRHLGEPPKEFIWNGKKYTPKSFFKDAVKLNMEDYIQFQSTLSQPFYTTGEFEVPDNWWHSADYYNVPLEDFIRAINGAVEAGYTLSIGGDVSEPGYNGWNEAVVVPSFDIPQEYINQDSRELRIYNKTTDDDHGVHMIGYTKMDGHYWYLIKDSARSARQGEHKGYHFYRDDYVKLKMLTFCVHKDAVKGLLEKTERNKPEKKEIELIPDGIFGKK
jgi:bleomycin hydrolase